MVVLPALAGLAALAGAGKLYSYARRPVWSGRLVIEHAAGEVQEVNLGRFGRKRRITLGRGGDLPLADPEHADLAGYLVLERRETDLGPAEVPCLHYRSFPGELLASQDFLYDGDAAVMGPFTVRYYRL